MPPPARKEILGATGSNTEQGGKGCPENGSDILGGGTTGPAIWVRHKVIETV